MALHLWEDYLKVIQVSSNFNHLILVIDFHFLQGMMYLYEPFQDIGVKIVRYWLDFPVDVSFFTMFQELKKSTRSEDDKFIEISFKMQFLFCQ